MLEARCFYNTATPHVGCTEVTLTWCWKQRVLDGNYTHCIEKRMTHKLGNGIIPALSLIKRKCFFAEWIKECQIWAIYFYYYACLLHLLVVVLGLPLAVLKNNLGIIHCRGKWKEISCDMGLQNTGYKYQWLKLNHLCYIRILSKEKCSWEICW